MFDHSAFKASFNCFLGSGNWTYLDNAATTQTPDIVVQTVYDYERGGRSNIKRGIYQKAEEATEKFEYARQSVANYLGVRDADEVVFTSGTTSAINLVAASLHEWIGPGDEIIISVLEHHSNILPWQMLAKKNGARLRALPLTDSGGVDLQSLETLLNKKTRLVALTHGSNVTGSKTDIAQVIELIRNFNTLIMLDGAQRVPHGPLTLDELGVDFYVFSGHKVYGPNGIGALWGRKEILDRLTPAWGGGEMVTSVELETSRFMPPPHRFEAGTLPITQAIGLGTALEWFTGKDVLGASKYLEYLTNMFIKGLMEIDREKKGITITGPAYGEDRLPLVSFALSSVHSHDVCQVMADEFDIALRGGHHCAQLAHEALGLTDTVRVSLAPYNNQDDIDRCLEGLQYCLGTLGE